MRSLPARCCCLTCGKGRSSGAGSTWVVRVVIRPWPPPVAVCAIGREGSGRCFMARIPGWLSRAGRASGARQSRWYSSLTEARTGISRAGWQGTWTGPVSVPGSMSASSESVIHRRDRVRDTGIGLPRRHPDPRSRGFPLGRGRGRPSPQPGDQGPSGAAGGSERTRDRRPVQRGIRGIPAAQELPAGAELLGSGGGDAVSGPGGGQAVSDGNESGCHMTAASWKLDLWLRNVTVAVSARADMSKLLARAPERILTQLSACFSI